MKNGASFYLICLVITCMIAGCVMTKKAELWEPVYPGQKSFVHIVRWSGEDLAIISLWYTGSGKNEEILVNNNPNINPKQLIIGDRIFIPKDILIITDPLTQEFVEKSVVKTERIEEQAPKSVVKPEETEGPESKSVTKSEKIEKRDSKSVAKEPQKKKPAPEPEETPEEEEELDLFGPR